MEQEPVAEVPERAPASLSAEQVRDRLEQVALFEGLGGADLEQILEISESVLVESGEYVFEEGERGDHFYIIVRGEIELRKAFGGGSKKLAILRAGQAFGEMALLNQTPRSASAYALEDTYMLSVSRDAFSDMLGGETLAVRLLRNLSKALWATSVRLAARQAQRVRSDTPHEALAEFNRLLRARLLPRVIPRVSGYDVIAATLTPKEGVGSSSWDWFLLPDGRPVFAVMKATRGDIFSAQRLATVRSLLRSLAEEHTSALAPLLTQVNRGLRSAWVEGLSGPVACALVALAEGACECAVSGGVAALLTRSAGTTEDLGRAQPPVGAVTDYTYRSTSSGLEAGDKVVLLTDRPPNAATLVTSTLGEVYTSSSRGALTSLFDRLGAARDLTGAVIKSTRSL